jgi:small-conductance mechanosensitive channel
MPASLCCRGASGATFDTMTTAEVAALENLLVGGWLLQIVQAVGLVVVAVVGMRLTLNWTGAAMRRGRVDTGTQILVKRGVVVTFVVLTVLIVLGILGVNPTSLLTIVGAVGLAFSLATQDILKNFFSGVYLLLERPFRVGDTIRIKDQQGVVENIGVRTTRLRTLENVQVLVPNVMVFTEVVTNHTHAHLVPNEQPTVDGQPATAAAAPSPAAVAGAVTTTNAVAGPTQPTPPVQPTAANPRV